MIIVSNTIAAISTAIGEAGIGIVRMSGKNSLEIGKEVFKGINDKKLDEYENRKMAYGHIVNGNEVIDEVLIAYMKEPYTYTKENMVEIYCHGGIIAVRRVLDLLLEKGAMIAEPGEFTKRAFLNGRLDLSQAEAVIDMIHSKTEKSYDIGLSQLDGSISKEVSDLRNRLIGIMANIVAEIDFPEEDIETITLNEIANGLKYISERIDHLLVNSKRGQILRDGINTVILGRPNVGKSSLLNTLSKKNRAIVTNIPGTTRDIIEEYINLDGIPLKIIDTAGIRETSDLVEKIGVDLARDAIKDANLLLVVLDNSESLNSEDREILQLAKDKNTIVIVNKSDLENKIDSKEIEMILGNVKTITTSILNNDGVDDILDTIKDMFFGGEIKVESDVYLSNVRHIDALKRTKKSIESALLDVNNNVPLDCIEVDLSDGLEYLGQITGESIGEDILDKIFSEFCLGK
ncbi:MAG: tRNA uridine-5-carboxymethylaminomethyl(34) synthesis GTPase MnmE [Tissierellia bacterium]|nr:tRNA uridine-5-carboxymethylaminomethyl(34) synthesis GTPase MnmE [Tissierellia bacterium]